MHRAWRIGLALLFCCAAGAALAQVPPQISPGAINNEQQRQQQQMENTQPHPEIAPQQSPVTGSAIPEGPGIPAAPGVTFVLKRVTFDASNFLLPGELDAITRDYIGKTIGFDDLAAIVGKVNALYKEKGQVTARAILPPQRINDGVVHIALIEGKLGKIDVEGAKHMSPDYVRDRVPLAPGQVINVQDLTSDVVFFNRTNDAQIRALLKPGANFGQTDVELTLEEPPSNSLQAFVDNEGVDSTGQEEGGIFYRHSDLLVDGDRTTIYGTVSRGGVDGTVSYTAPFDTDGDRAVASYENNRISIIDGQFKGLAITGSGQTATLGVSRALVGTENWLVTATLDGSYDTSRTDQPTGVVADTTTWRAILGASATYIDSWLLATLSPSVAFARSDNSILHKGADIELFTGSGSAIVPLAKTWSIHLATAWQYSSESLLPADLLFQIGGPTSVRGYQAGTFAGDSGFYGNFELHHEFEDISKGLDMFLFYDAGMVFSTSPAQRSLDAIGIGGSLTPVPNTTLSASVGVPLSTAVPDQNGYQFYLQLAARL